MTLQQRPLGDLAGILRWPTPRSEEWTKELLLRVHLDREVAAVVAIGSAVREGVATADLDLLLVHRVRPELPQPPVEIDLRYFSAAVVEDRVLNGDDLLGWAVMFGHVLHEKDTYWSSLVASIGSSVPLPSAEEARARASRASSHLHQMLEMGDEEAAREQLLTLITHLARIRLVELGIYPRSRPELPAQLTNAGEEPLAGVFRAVLAAARPPRELLGQLEELRLAS